MGDVASKDAFEWLLSDPKILCGSKLVCRCMDDIVTRKRSLVGKGKGVGPTHPGVHQRGARRGRRLATSKVDLGPLFDAPSPSLPPSLAVAFSSS
ncbi:hypothetical protein CRG98_008351 [Punica granatum]|uniref:Uncharacterized protein n=1 Tax=Punica granatum TaxID=22663 RepID=A0A2I0KS04_PUNGR|nr:hypothetical protein CRG98_008351 [Punica granatum]